MDFRWAQPLLSLVPISVWVCVHLVVLCFCLLCVCLVVSILFFLPCCSVAITQCESTQNLVHSACCYFVGVRYHGMFDDDNGPVVTGFGDGKYNFSALDNTWDYLLSIGVRPIVELSFMPAFIANCSWYGINPTAERCGGTCFAYHVSILIAWVAVCVWGHVQHVHIAWRYTATTCTFLKSPYPLGLKTLFTTGIN